jgi:hypothetical protein
VTVSYATADGTAVAPADYQPRAGTLTFPPGTLGPQLVSVPIVGDLQDEPDESFVLNLTSPVGAALADNQAVAIVVDDDAPAGEAGEGSGAELVDQVAVVEAGHLGQPVRVGGQVALDARPLVRPEPLAMHHDVARARGGERIE